MEAYHPVGDLVSAHLASDTKRKHIQECAVTRRESVLLTVNYPHTKIW